MKIFKSFLFTCAVFIFFTACTSQEAVPTAAAAPTTKPLPTQKANVLNTKGPASKTPSAASNQLDSTAESDPENPTENSEVNQTITALLSQDIEFLQERISINTQGCTTQDGLGGPPKCKTGQPDGTPVNFLPALGPGEGSYLLPEETIRIFDYQSVKLFAVIQVAPMNFEDPVFPAGEYAVVLEIQPEGFARTFRLDAEGNIVRVDYTAWTKEEEIRNIAGDILFIQQ